MNTRRSVAVCTLLTLAAALYSAFMWSRLPDQVPTHWNIQGQPDGYGSKLVALLMMLGIMLLVNLMTVVLPAISPEKFGVESFRKTFNYVMVLIVGLLGVLHFLILRATAVGTFEFQGALLAVIFGFFAAIGNVMGKVRQNFWMGVRTPWTLADERVWDQTHRSAARLWTLGGLVGAVLSLANAPLPVLFAFLMAISLWPVANSYLIYQKIHRGGSAA